MSRGRSPGGGSGPSSFDTMTWASFLPILEPLTFEGDHCIPAGDIAWVPDVHLSGLFQVVHP